MFKGCPRCKLGDLACVQDEDFDWEWYCVQCSTRLPVVWRDGKPYLEEVVNEQEDAV